MKIPHKTQSQKWPLRLLLRWTLGLGVLLFTLWVYFDLAEDVLFHEGFAWDKPIIMAIHQFSSPASDQFMLAVTQMGQAGAILVAIAAGVYFAKKKNWLDSIAVLFSLAAGEAINTLLKIMLVRPRPTLFIPLVNESGFSFPSGHVTAAGAVFGFLAVVLWRKGKRLWAALCVALVLAVAISRIYLGVHYPSDTLSALIFSFLWLIILFFVRDRYQSQHS
jgi:undecaprenyl-diphosphatase